MCGRAVALGPLPRARRGAHDEIGTISVTIVVEAASGAVVQALPIEGSGSRWQARVGPIDVPDLAKRSRVANRNRTVAVHIDRWDTVLGEPLIAEGRCVANVRFTVLVDVARLVGVPHDQLGRCADLLAVTLGASLSQTPEAGGGSSLTVWLP